MCSKKVLELNSMKRLESQEDYLERILQISQRKESVHAVDIARDMNFSNPVNIQNLYYKFCFNPELLLLSDYTIGLPKK